MKLRTVDIGRVLAVSTDDSLPAVDEVYNISFLICGAGEGDGNHPGSFVPMLTKTVTHQSTTMNCPQGVAVTPYTAWGRIYPSHSAHDTCCQGQGQSVSGQVFFFDSDASRGWSFMRVFGIVAIIMLSIGLSAGVGLALIANPPLAIFTGWMTGMIASGILTLLWVRFLESVSEDEYLGGIRVTFPCDSGQARIEQTFDLIGAANGIQSDARAGRPAIKWSGSSAKYKVTFLAQYS